MESIFKDFDEVKSMLVEIDKRLDEIEAKLDALTPKPKPVNIQQDVEMQTALKGILNATRKL